MRATGWGSGDYVSFGRDICVAIHAFSSRAEAGGAGAGAGGDGGGEEAGDGSSDSEEGDSDEPSDFSSDGDDADFAFETLSSSPRHPLPRRRLYGPPGPGRVPVQPGSDGPVPRIGRGRLDDVAAPPRRGRGSAAGGGLHCAHERLEVSPPQPLMY